MNSTSSTRSPSKPSSLSSTTTLQDDNGDRHDITPLMEDGNHPTVSVDVGVSVRVTISDQRRRKPKHNVTQQPVELGYRKVLRAMTTEPTELLTTTDSTTSTIRNTEETTDIESRSWKHALRLLGMRRLSQSNKAPRSIFNLSDDGVARVLEHLVAEFGHGTSSSFLDGTYSIYLQQDERAAVCFKVIGKVAVMYGDPLCAADQIHLVFDAFRSHCQRHGWHVAVVGAGSVLTTYAKSQCWRTMEFAVEQILNPMKNGILDETSGKTIVRTNRKLVANGIKLHLYEPRRGIQPQLEQDLMKVYNAWREDRRQRNAPQAYSAVINPFGLPRVTRYMYTTGSDGKPDSLAGLIQIGRDGGYLLEPCIQLADAPKGVTGFLVTHAMGLLRDEGVTYMTFGLEALPELGEISMMPSLIEDTSRRIYRTTFNALGLLGRKKFHESFHPEKNQQVPLFLLFPPGLPRVGVYQAVLDATHISPHEVWRRSRAARSAKREQNKAARSKPPATTVQSGQQRAVVASSGSIEK